MFTPSLGPRKRRTRQHVIEDLSIHHVEGFILEEGHAVQRVTKDYGYDLILFTYDEEGQFEPGLVLFQLKASEALKSVNENYVFDIDIRDYNLWIRVKDPVIIVLFDASRRTAFWLAFQKHFWENTHYRPKKGAKSVRIRVPMRQVVDRQAISAIRDLKWETWLPRVQS